ncbi:hypothetical protein [Flavobacterium pectinovorum]|uniref:Uncharacterized protein n=1 Tax=Flavobacterium pectinovorum TaxID=29533 RepID=A0A502EWL7_9FLAO|nr:hypothetical protein [Flavobacterium pectinovorum]TPG41947.1 hypothetical protein EAH81_06390 [Flavobacterium pectinovorum]
MFKFFKKQKKIHLVGWEKDLFSNLFKLLGDEYNYFREQVSEGIIESIRLEKKIPNYINFRLNIILLNKFEKKKEPFFTINGIKIFDKTSGAYRLLSLDLGYGLILGYSTSDILNFNPDPDIQKIVIDSIYITYPDNEDFNKIKSLLSNEEINLLNASDIYEVELEGKMYYHLKDLEDGDFIGMDMNKNIYKITHDPFQIIVEENQLINLLK